MVWDMILFRERSGKHSELPFRSGGVSRMTSRRARGGLGGREKVTTTTRAEEGRTRTEGGGETGGEAAGAAGCLIGRGYGGGPSLALAPLAPAPSCHPWAGRNPPDRNPLKMGPRTPPGVQTHQFFALGAAAAARRAPGGREAPSLDPRGSNFEIRPDFVQDAGGLGALPGGGAPPRQVGLRRRRPGGPGAVAAAGPAAAADVAA